jgi:uncharacterized membrane protein
MWIAFLAMAFGGTTLMTVGWMALQGRLKRQHWAGIRTSYTMANDEQWYATHRHAAPYLIFGGVAALAMSLSLLPFALAGQLPDVFSITMALIIAAVTLFAVLTSWRSGVRGAKVELGQ